MIYLDFQTLTNPTKVKILNLLYENPQTLKILNKNIDISKPELSRHLTTLRDLELVERSESINMLTSLGQIIVEILSPLDFIIKHFDFFQNHSFQDIPTFLLRDFDALLDTERIVGLGYVMKKFDETFTFQGENTYAMMDQPIKGPSEDVSIVTKGYYILPNHTKDENITDEILLKSHKEFEIRKLRTVPVGLGKLDDKVGFLFFADKQGKIDFSSAFYVSDALGISFLNKLWCYYWDSAEFYKKYP